MSALNNVIKLTTSQYNTLKTNGSITVGETTYNYDANTIYLTDANESAVPFHSATIFTSSTSYSYTGISFTIPANCYFVVSVVAQYENGAPQEVGINTTTNNDVYTVAHQTVSSNHNDAELTCTWSGRTDSSSITRYIWAKYASAASNTIIINGFYVKDSSSLALATPYLPLTGGTLSGDLYTTNRIYMKAPNTSSDAPAICFLRGTYGSDANTDWLISEDTYDNLLIESYKNGAVNVKVMIDNSNFNVYNDIVARNKGIYGFNSSNQITIFMDGPTGTLNLWRPHTSEDPTDGTHPEIRFGDDQTVALAFDSHDSYINGSGLTLYPKASEPLYFKVNGDCYCTAIYGTGTFVSSKYLFFGTNMAPNWNNLLDIGGSGLSWHYIYANGGSWTSDRRLKENIVDTELEALPLINQLSIRDYNWKDGQKEKSIGIIAQELRDIVPEKYEGIFIRGEETKDKYLSIDSGALVMLSLKAIQEQQSKIKELEDRIKELEK